MVKTFIYGNPHGFDLFEKDSAYSDYVKGFYISSRKGRRMMVNRRENGETTYNYLHYGLREAIDRPTNAFWGMTLVLDGHQYCEDFKEILDWFDYIFDRIVKERNIFAKDETGKPIYPLKYRIHKFEEASSDIEWIKANLPNIFSDGAGTSISKYDSSFLRGNTGQVIGLNEKETTENILKTFRQYSWITLSSQYALRTDDEIIDKNSELNYIDLKEKIERSYKRFSQLAARTDKEAAGELMLMKKGLAESLALMTDYFKRITDKKETELFEQLIAEYNSFIKNITALLLKGESEISFKNVQYCFNCKQEKDVSCFSSPDATKCIECEASEQRETKKRCIKCGQYKNIYEFGNENNVCKACQEQETTQTKTCKQCGRKKALSDFSINSDICHECSDFVDWRKFLGNKRIIMGVLAAIILCVIIFVFTDSEKKPPINKELMQQTEEIIETENAETQKVSAATLNDLLKKEQFSEAYDYINDKDDKDIYIDDIANAVDKKFWSVIENSETTEYDAIKSQLEIEIRPFEDLLAKLGVDNQYYDKLYNGAKDYAKLRSLLEKVQITETEYNEGKQILNRIGKYLKGDWNTALASKWEVSKASATNISVSQNKEKESTTTKKQTKTVGPVSITYTKVNGNEENATDLKGNVGYDAKPGTKVTVTYPNGKITYNKQTFNNTKSITLDSNPEKQMTYVFKCDNVVITITTNPTQKSSFNKQ